MQPVGDSSKRARASGISPDQDERIENGAERGRARGVQRAVAIEVASPEAGDIGAREERKRVRSKRSGRIEVEQNATCTCPQQPRSHPSCPGQPHDDDEDEVGKRASDLELRRPRHLDQCGGQHQREPADDLHEGLKSVTTMTKLNAAGSLTQSMRAESTVAASLCVTLTTSPTTSPRG